MYNSIAPTDPIDTLWFSITNHLYSEVYILAIKVSPELKVGIKDLIPEVNHFRKLDNSLQYIYGPLFFIPRDGHSPQAIHRDYSIRKRKAASV